jgi:hypothetical protein
MIPENRLAYSWPIAGLKHFIGSKFAPVKTKKVNRRESGLNEAAPSWIAFAGTIGALAEFG